MSTSLNAVAYSSKENPEFKKNLEAVKFCIQNHLSFPKETSEFFKGKLAGDDLEDINPDSILKYIENGVEVDMTFRYFKSSEVHINVSEIPKEAEVIIVKLS